MKNNNKIKINKFEKIMPKKGWFYIVIVLFLIGLLLLILSLNDYIKLYIIKSHEIVVGNTITSNLIYTGTTSESDWYPKYEYKYVVKGIEYNDYDVIRTSKLFWNLPEENEEIKILYNKNNPEKSDIFFIDYRGILFSILLVIISIFLYRKVKKWNIVE